MLYDIFISHASEDKTTLVRELAKRLKENHIEVWYDEFSLKIGDSLRRSIDLGLSKSRYCIVVFSKNFFNKKWPQWELDGLVSLQNNTKSNLILPIWHNITKEELIQYSPSLADKIALNSSIGIDNLVKKIIEVIKPEGSTLLIARDVLIEHNFEPPVVTDDWWLDVVEFCGSDYWHNHWGFPLPSHNRTPQERGYSLAFAAMQREWQFQTEKYSISQITHPDEVLGFIKSQPGLTETCFKHLYTLAAYVPQLTIKGMGGIFENEFEKNYQISIEKQIKELRNGSELGTGLTTDKLSPLCDERWALRNDNFGNYRPETITCNYVQGELMGENVKVFEIFDYLIWFISDTSYWFHERIKKFIIQGFKEWSVWEWGHYNVTEIDIDSHKYNSAGRLFHKMYNVKTPTKFKLNKRSLNDLECRIYITKKLLNIMESIDNLVDKFISEKFIEEWIIHRNKKMH
jgi:hypothetical protein